MFALPETVLLQKGQYLGTVDGFPFRLVVDGQQVYHGLLYGNYHGSKCDDTGTASFPMTFGCNGHTDFPQASAEIGSKSGILFKFIKKTGIIVCY